MMSVADQDRVEDGDRVIIFNGVTIQELRKFDSDIYCDFPCYGWNQEQSVHESEGCLHLHDVYKERESFKRIWRVPGHTGGLHCGLPRQDVRGQLRQEVQLEIKHMMNTIIHKTYVAYKEF